MKDYDSDILPPKPMTVGVLYNHLKSLMERYPVEDEFVHVGKRGWMIDLDIFDGHVAAWTFQDYEEREKE